MSARTGRSDVGHGPGDGTRVGGVHRLHFEWTRERSSTRVQWTSPQGSTTRRTSVRLPRPSSLRKIRRPDATVPLSALSITQRPRQEFRVLGPSSSLRRVNTHFCSRKPFRMFLLKIKGRIKHSAITFFQEIPPPYSSHKTENKNMNESEHSRKVH